MGRACSRVLFTSLFKVSYTAARFSLVLLYYPFDVLSSSFRGFRGTMLLENSLLDVARQFCSQHAGARKAGDARRTSRYDLHSRASLLSRAANTL